MSSIKEEKPWLKEVDKFALESAVEHVDSAYKNFFKKKAGFPHFASKYKPNGNVYSTKQTNGNIRLVYGKEDKLPYIKLPKVGIVRVILPKKTLLSDLVPKKTKILKATVRHQGNRYFLSLGLECIIDKIIPCNDFNISDIVGIDVGIKDFCHWGTLENKITVENPRWIKLHEKRLRRFQKSMSRKQYDKKTHIGSNNYYKAKNRVTKEYSKIRNQRKDFHHKLSRKIVNSCKVFVREDLNIKAMMKNRHLSKAIASVGWGQFFTFVEYKIKKARGIFIKANRWYPSSQKCHKCGYKNTDVKDLSIRKWKCPKCGTWHDRDDNAVDNLILYAMKELNIKAA